MSKAPATMASRAIIHILAVTLMMSAHVSASDVATAIKASCAVQAKTAMCQSFANQQDVSAWLTKHFVEAPIASPALVTGYYQPIIAARLTPSKEFSAPLFGLPTNAEDFRLSRAQLRRPNPLPVLAYVADEVDAFFIGIQGSALLNTEAGLLSVAYAGTNGATYHAIGKTLVAKGALTPEAVSMDSIKAWLRANPLAQSEVLDNNPRLIYFKQGKNTEAIGAQGVALTARHSVAVDPAHHAYGSLLRLEVNGKTHFVVAQDTGSAIKGETRIDLFMGSGDAAGSIAGGMKERGRLSRLVFQAKPLGS